MTRTTVLQRAISSSGLQQRRSLATVPSRHYDAVIVGAGPGGLTCASTLLDNGLSKICMIDPSFTGGRINDRYREVPSNTKAGLFSQWATGTETFSRILESTKSPNAFDKLKSLDPDQGCQLGDAVDVAILLSNGLRSDPRVETITGKVQRLIRNHQTWDLPGSDLTTDRVVLAQGSHPRRHNLVEHYPHLTPLDLDTCLKPSALRESIGSKAKIGVIGSSHSAILALKNLYELGNIDIVNFYRSPLLYAVYKDGWILHDNTGLKGIAADWAHDMLEDEERLPPNLRRVDLKDGARSEKEIYDSELKDCTHLVSAVGFDVNPVPQVKLERVAKATKPKFDPLTGKFFRAQGDSEYVPGLFGAGIAYPERVTDRVGNVESAVGWFKFMDFASRVVPEWVGK